MKQRADIIINNDLLLVLSTPAGLKVYLGSSPIELKVGIGWPKMKGFVDGF